MCFRWRRRRGGSLELGELGKRSLFSRVSVFVLATSSMTYFRPFLSQGRDLRSLGSSSRLPRFVALFFLSKLPFNPFGHADSTLLYPSRHQPNRLLVGKLARRRSTVKTCSVLPSSPTKGRSKSQLDLQTNLLAFLPLPIDRYRILLLLDPQATGTDNSHRPSLLIRPLFLTTCSLLPSRILSLSDPLKTRRRRLTNPTSRLRRQEIL